jgi:vesicle coat complex subunit
MPAQGPAEIQPQWEMSACEDEWSDYRGTIGQRMKIATYNSQLVSDQELVTGVGEVLVQDAVQAACLVLVAVDAVLDLFRGVTEEMVGLTLHWAYSSILEKSSNCLSIHRDEQCVCMGVVLTASSSSIRINRQYTMNVKNVWRKTTHLDILPGSSWVADLVLGIVAINKVLHDASTLEQSDRLAIRERVGQGGDAAIGVDGEEPRFLLGTVGSVELSVRRVLRKLSYFLEMSILVCSYLRLMPVVRCMALWLSGLLVKLTQVLRA